MVEIYESYSKESISIHLSTIECWKEKREVARKEMGERKSENESESARACCVCVCVCSCVYSNDNCKEIVKLIIRMQ